MKKTLFTVLAITVMAVGAMAQQTLIIPKVGLTLSKWGGDDVEDTKLKPGFLLGAGFQLGITENFSIQPELLFIQKGVRSEDDDFDFKVKITQNYLEAPILAKYSFGPVYINAGPSLALGLSGKQKAERGSQKEEDVIKFGEASDEFKTIDLGFQLGAGAAFEAGSGKVVIDLRYGLGLSSISNVDDSDVFNRAFSVSIGYALPIGGK